MKFIRVCVGAIIVAMAICSCAAGKAVVETKVADGVSAAKDTVVAAASTASRATLAPEATPTGPVVAGAAAATGVPAAQHKSDDGIERLVSLSEVKSYRQSIRFTVTRDDETESWMLTSEYDASIPAQRWVSEVIESGGAEPIMVESIYIDGITYMRFEDEAWVATSTDDEEIVGAELATWAQAEDVFDGQGCNRQGSEKVNGYDTVHYRCDDRLFGLPGPSLGAQTFGAMTEGTVDMWIEPDLRVAVREVVEWRGKDGEDRDYTSTYVVDVTDINKPVAIAKPEGVQEPGASVDIPIVPGSETTMKVGPLTSYEVAKPLDEVVAFYEREMGREGWTKEEGSVPMPGFMTFTKGDRTVQVIAMEDGDTTTVQVMEEE